MNWNVDGFLNQVLGADFFIVVGTPEYKLWLDRKLLKSGSSSVDKTVREFLERRLTQQKSSIIPIIREGEVTTSLSPELATIEPILFNDDEYYGERLLTLLLRIHSTLGA